MPKYTVEIDYSTMDTMLICERKAMYQYHDGYTRTSEIAGALDFGKCIHTFLEMYTHDNFEYAKSIALTEAKKTKLKEVEDGQRYSLSHLTQLMAEYDKAYATDNRYKTLKTELKLKYTLLDSEELKIIWVGNVDKVAIDTMFDEPVIFEHKTAYTTGEQFENKTWPNHQVLGYYMLAQKAGYDVKKIIFNVLKTTGYYKTKGGKISGDLLTNPTDCFIRYEVPVDDTFVNEFELLVVQVVKDLIAMTEGKRAVKFNPPNSCTMFNSKCLFHDVCKSYPNERKDILDFNYEKRPWAHFKITREE